MIEARNRYWVLGLGGAILLGGSAVLVGTSSWAQGEDPPALYCPTADELQQQWEKEGQEIKADPDCPDPDPLPDEDANNPAEEPGSDNSASAPKTLAEAQEKFDPHNEPLVLLAQNEDGSYYAINGTASKESTPPPSVQTVEQYAAWLQDQSKEANE
jgi:hypothetical protein